MAINDNNKTKHSALMRSKWSNQPVTIITPEAESIDGRLIFSNGQVCEILSRFGVKMGWKLSDILIIT